MGLYNEVYYILMYNFALSLLKSFCRSFDPWARISWSGLGLSYVAHQSPPSQVCL